MMSDRTACFVGSFDPMTKGHLNIIERASQMFDKITIGVGVNSRKVYMFELNERVELVQEAIGQMGNVEVKSFSGLAVDFIAQSDASILLRSVRTESDVGYELQLAQMNKKLNPEIETVLLFADQGLSHISSTFVKDVLKSGGDFSDFVPSSIHAKIGGLVVRKERDR